MTRQLVRAVLLASLLAGIRATHARQDATPGSRWTDARAAAMGDAYIAFAEGVADSLFYNPAGLAKIRPFVKAEPFTLQLAPGMNYLTTVGLESWKLPMLGSYLPTIAASGGPRHTLKAGSFHGMAIKGFAFGLMTNFEYSAVQDSSDNVKYTTLYQFIPTAGFGLPLAHGLVRLGYSIQWVQQISGTGNTDLTNTGASFLEGVNQGSGFSHTLGASLQLPTQMAPSFHLVTRNFLGTTYSTTMLLPMATNSPGAPAIEALSFDVAAAVQPKFGLGYGMNLSAEVHDFTGTSESSLLSKISIGAEFHAKDRFFLRAGFGSGYPSAGFGLKGKKGDFSVSWYSEEWGTSFQTSRNLVLMLQLKFTP